MNDSTLHSVLLVLVMAVVTYLLRAFPFMVFSGKKPTPEFVLYLGKVLPYAIIGMLVIYCIKDISFVSLGNFFAVYYCWSSCGVASHMETKYTFVHYSRNAFLYGACTVCFLITY